MGDGGRECASEERRVDAGAGQEGDAKDPMRRAFVLRVIRICKCRWRKIVCDMNIRVCYVLSLARGVLF